MNVTCPECGTVYRVDPDKVPAEGVRARCANCPEVFRVEAPTAATAEVGGTTPITVGEDFRGEDRDVMGVVGPTGGEWGRSADVAEAPSVEGPEFPEGPAAQAASVEPGSLDHAADGGVMGSASQDLAEAVSGEVVEANSYDAEGGADVGEAAAMEADSPDAVEAAAGFTEAAPADDQEAPSNDAEPAPAWPGEERSGEYGAPPAAVPPPRDSELPPPPFGSTDPHQRARRLARALVSDIVVYHPDRRARSLRQGTVRQEFREEIRKSWDEYAAQVGNEFARETSYFRDALNEILADGSHVF